MNTHPGVCASHCQDATAAAPSCDPPTSWARHPLCGALLLPFPGTCTHMNASTYTCTHAHLPLVHTCTHTCTNMPMCAHTSPYLPTVSHLMMHIYPTSLTPYSFVLSDRELKAPVPDLWSPWGCGPASWRPTVSSHCLHPNLRPHPAWPGLCWCPPVQATLSARRPGN